MIIRYLDPRDTHEGPVMKGSVMLFVKCEACCVMNDLGLRSSALRDLDLYRV